MLFSFAVLTLIWSRSGNNKTKTKPSSRSPRAPSWSTRNFRQSDVINDSPTTSWLLDVIWDADYVAVERTYNMNGRTGPGATTYVYICTRCHVDYPGAGELQKTKRYIRYGMQLMKSKCAFPHVELQPAAPSRRSTDSTQRVRCPFVVCIDLSTTKRTHT